MRNFSVYFFIYTLCFWFLWTFPLCDNNLLVCACLSLYTVCVYSATVWLSTIVFTSLCDNVCVRVACACLSIYWYFAFKTLFCTFFWADIDVLCLCGSHCIFAYVQVVHVFECVYEAELIFLHESKQQGALTFSKQQACSYFDIDNHCAFTVKCGWIGVGACWIRSIH